MTPEQFQHLEDLFHHALTLDAPARAAWLASLDPESARAVGQLLAQDTSGNAALTRVATALSQTDSKTEPGQRLGPWRLLREIGAGGVGVVWLAERADGQYDLQVAIKINRGYAGAGAQAQLRHERQILAALDHPVIAGLIDGGETADGHPYLVMEYVEGQPITVAANQQGLDLRARVGLLVQLAHAVHYAHQRLIIHRDIKPANVLLRADGRPRLLDFGIAKLFSADTDGVQPTQPWFTPAYAAPEQKRNAPISTATDIYALGLLMVELLSGQMPEIDAHGQVTPPSQRGQQQAWHGALRQELDAIALRACAPEPERRYDSAAAFAEDLQRWQKGRPIKARPDSNWYRLRKFVYRHQLGTSLALIALLTILGISWWLAVERNRARAAEQQALQASQSAAASASFLVGLFRQAEPSLDRPSALTPLQLLDQGRAKLRADHELSVPIRIQLMSTLGAMYGDLGAAETATAVLREAIDLAIQHAEPAEVQLDLWLALGQASIDRARYADAEQSWRKVLELLGDHADPDRSRQAGGLLAISLARGGRLAEGKSELAVWRSTCPEPGQGQRTESCWTLDEHLGEILALEGDLEAARKLVDPAVQALALLSKPGDADLQSARLTQASILRQSQQLDAAESVLKQLLGERSRMVQQDSVLLSSVYSELGSVYYEQGRTRDALAQFELAVATGTRSLRADDPSLVIDLNNLASLLEDRGLYRKAEPLFRQALGIIRQFPEEQAANIGNFQQNLGRVLMLLGELEQAWPYVSAPIPDGERQLMSLLQVRRALQMAEWYRRSGDLQKARLNLNDVLARLDEFGGTEHPRFAAVLRAQGLLAQAEGNFQTAETHLKAALQHWQYTVGPDYIGCGEVELDLALLMQARGKPAAAAAHYQRAVRISSQHLDPAGEAWRNLVQVAQTIGAPAPTVGRNAPHH